MRATYRLQLSLDLPVADVCQLVPYLSDLGISHLYRRRACRPARARRTATTWWTPPRVSKALGGGAGLREHRRPADPAGYLRKLREAGVERVWVEKILHPGEDLHEWPVEGTVGYESLNEVAALFVDPAAESALPFAAVVAAEGRRAALGQTLHKLTVPGVPDVYQGDELEALSLVDPDNRRSRRVVGVRDRRRRSCAASRATSGT